MKENTLSNPVYTPPQTEVLKVSFEGYPLMLSGTGENANMQKGSDFDSFFNN